MDAKEKEAVELVAQSKEAVLATLENGKPFTSSVNYLYSAHEKFGKIFILISSLARHTKNIIKNPDVSLQVLENASQPLYQRKRVSIQGRLSQVNDPGIFENCRTHYIKVFPEAGIFFTLSDFHFYEMEITELYFIGGFGKIQSFAAGGK